MTPHNVLHINTFLLIIIWFDFDNFSPFYPFSTFHFTENFSKKYKILKFLLKFPISERKSDLVTDFTLH